MNNIGNRDNSNNYNHNTKTKIYSKILYELANGTNPMTGEENDEWILEQPEIIRALYAGALALDKLTEEPTFPEETPIIKANEPKPSNSGKKWTSEDDTILFEAFNNGESISDLAVDFGRSEHAIAARLEKLLDVTPDEIIRTVIHFRNSKSSG